ncbi:hypothetical protein AB1Y20_013657 [Prymnesium parvum]|uniref:Uncharacterized protein n=1 Tax=Prymnesium parvum TaxID=97485 RepID=A0AB34IHY0_PRYPA
MEVVVVLSPHALERGVAAEIGARLHRRFPLRGMRLAPLPPSLASELPAAPPPPLCDSSRPATSPPRFLFTLWEADPAAAERFVGSPDDPPAGSLRHEFGVAALLGAFASPRLAEFPVELRLCRSAAGLRLSIARRAPLALTVARRGEGCAIAIAAREGAAHEAHAAPRRAAVS